MSAFLTLMLTPHARAQDLKASVEQLARDLGNSVPEGRTLIIAVSDFPDLQKTVSDLGRYIAERLVTRLSARPEKFRVIERSRLDQVLSELRFSYTDLVDPANAERLGKMLGVQAIVVGTLSDLGNNVDIDARIIEIGTNGTLPGVSVTLSKDDTVRQLLERGRQMPASAGGHSGGTPPYQPVSDSLGAYESPELRVEVDSAKVIDSRRILINLRYINRRKSPMAIALNKAHSSLLDTYPTYASDEIGNMHRLAIVSVMSDKPLTLLPGIPVTAAFTFSPADAPGKIFSIFSETVLFEVDENERALDQIKTLRVLIQNIKMGR